MNGEPGPLRWVVPLVMVLLVSGCAVVDQRPEPVSISVAAPRPLGVDDPAVVPSASPAPAPACDPRASLRPRGPLPAPGQISSRGQMDAILQRGRLVVGVDQNTYLFSYPDPVTGQLIGFDIDIAREIARAIFGSPDAIHFIAISQADRIPAIRQGRVDVVVDTMTITCQRLQEVAFSTEYLTAGQRVLVHRGSSFRSLDDLGGKKVCAAKGTTSLQAILEAPSRPVAVGAEVTADCMVLLQQDQVDAISTDDTVLAGYAEQDRSTEVVGSRFSDEPYGVAVAKDAPEFVRFINAVLERIRADGTWRRLYERWLSTLGPAPAPPVPRYRD